MDPGISTIYSMDLGLPHVNKSLLQVNTFVVKKGATRYIIRAEGTQVPSKLEDVALEIADLIEKAKPFLLTPILKEKHIYPRQAAKAIKFFIEEKGSIFVEQKNMEFFCIKRERLVVNEKMKKFFERMIGLNGTLCIYKLDSLQGGGVIINHQKQLELVLKERVEGTWFRFLDGRKLVDKNDIETVVNGVFKSAYVKNNDVYFSGSDQFKAEELEVEVQDLDSIIQQKLLRKLREELEINIPVLSNKQVEEILQVEEEGNWMARKNEKGQLVITAKMFNQRDESQFTHTLFTDVPSIRDFHKYFEPGRRCCIY